MSFSDACHEQAQNCDRLGSPFTATLCRTFAEVWKPDTGLGLHFAGFDGAIGPAGHSLPLRLCAGLHALVLSDRAPDLQAIYPPHTPADSINEVVSQAIDAQQDFLIDWTRLPPQTNEVRRAAALQAMARVAAQHFDLPLHLSELGASGGLNLFWDHVAVDLGGTLLGPGSPALTLAPDWTGPPPPACLPQIASRRGVDLNPLDPTAPDDLLRLSSYLWPDQPFRIEYTRSLAAIATPVVDQGDAIDWLEHRLAHAPDGHLHLVQHSVAWQYFSPAAKVRGTALIEQAGRAATRARPLAWASMETDADTPSVGGAALTLRLWPGDLKRTLGRADFHGRWIRWTPDG